MSETISPEDHLKSIADSLIKIKKVAENLESTGLSQYTTVLLLHDLSKVPKKQIRKVLVAMGNVDKFLEDDY